MADLISPTSHRRKLEEATGIALQKLIYIMQMPLDPDDRYYAKILSAQREASATILAIAAKVDEIGLLRSDNVARQRQIAELYQRLAPHVVEWERERASRLQEAAAAGDDAAADALRQQRRSLAAQAAEGDAVAAAALVRVLAAQAADDGEAAADEPVPGHASPLIDVPAAACGRHPAVRNVSSSPAATAQSVGVPSGNREVAGASGFF
jgi:hypothetical protein